MPALRRLTAGQSPISIGRDSATKRIVEMTILEALCLGVINTGPNDYKQMLQNTMLSSEMNKL